MKCWLIEAGALLCGATENYAAYAEENPEQKLIDSGIWDTIIDDLWQNYSWMLHLDDEEFESKDEEDEAWQEAWDDWEQGSYINVEEMEESELLSYFPDNKPDIIYDERT